jgi:23S rRNA pseudouridine1911/1915/1917 synthase
MELKHTAARAARLSAVLKEDMRLSTGLINRLKWQQRIFVNGTPQHNDYAVQPGDVITVPLDEEAPQYPAEQGSLTILYEDDHLLAVDKPAGMLIHPSRATMTGTLANRVIGYYAATGQKAAFHPLTRLDRDTFGLVLIAKNSHIHALLQQMPVQKTYHALVLGGPEGERGTIDAPIARRPLPSLLREVRPDGKPSVTEYAVLEQDGILCKLALRPITGRTHQLRVHCAHMGFPILGDPQYGTARSNALSREMGLTTQALCAKQLEFTHPITGGPMHLTSRLDASLP